MLQEARIVFSEKLENALRSSLESLLRETWKASLHKPRIRISRKSKRFFGEDWKILLKMLNGSLLEARQFLQEA